ncbi:hypothetical protein N7449_010825, partial [Penicillium cf. viridicatum]
MISDQRKRVREAFLREFPKIIKMEYFPEKPSPSNLIWDKNIGYLYATDPSYNLISLVSVIRCLSNPMNNLVNRLKRGCQ